MQQTLTSSSLPSRWGQLLRADQDTRPGHPSGPREREQTREQASGLRSRSEALAPGHPGVTNRGSRGAARRRRGPSSPDGRALRLHTASDRRRVPGRAVCAGRETGRTMMRGIGAVWGRRHCPALTCPHSAQWEGWRFPPGLAEAAVSAEATRPAGPAASAFWVAELCLEPLGPAVCCHLPCEERWSLQKGLGRLGSLWCTQTRVHLVCVVCSVCVRACDFIFTAVCLPRDTQPLVSRHEKEQATSSCPNQSRAKPILSPSLQGRLRFLDARSSHASADECLSPLRR